MEPFGMNTTPGQNWILLRGLARESAHWGAFVPQLRAAFPDAANNAAGLARHRLFVPGRQPNHDPRNHDNVRRQALARVTYSNRQRCWPCRGGDGRLGVDASYRTIFVVPP